MAGCTTGESGRDLAFSAIPEELIKCNDNIPVIIYVDKCAKYIESELNIKTINKEMYFYDNGVYRSGGEDIIRTYLTNMFFNTYDEFGDSVANRKVQNEIIYKLQTLTRVKLEDFDKDLNIINLKNGFFNFRTKEFIAHSANNPYLSMIQHPIEYDPDATCLNIDLILERLTPNKTHQKALKEWVSYCFYRDVIIKKSLVLYGPEGTGKSIFTELCNGMIGIEYSNFIELNRITNARFDLSGLKGMCRNNCGETPATEVQKFDVFKKITGRDYVNSDVKNKESIKFKPFVKIEMMLNEMFKTKDKTNAFYMRLLIIMFLHHFTKEEKQRDAELMNALKDPKELSGFFNECMELLPGLIDRKAFTYNPSAQEIERQFNRLSEPISEFVDKFVLQDEDDKVGRDYLFEKFETFSKFNDTKADRKEFDKFIKSLDCVKPYIGDQCKKRYGDKLKMAWPNLKFNEEAFKIYDI